MSRDEFERERNEEATVLFNKLYRDHHRPIYAYLHGKCGCSETAADLLQETFVRVWTNIHKAMQIPHEKVRFWLFALGRSASYDHARRSRIRKGMEAPLASVETLRAENGDPATAVREKESLTELNAAIRRLPEKLRIALTMHAHGGMTSAEIGSALGLPAGTARYRISEARKRLASDMRLTEQTKPGNEVASDGK